MASFQSKVRDERVKAISGALSNGGLALLGATLGTIYLGKAQDDTIWWAIGGAFMLVGSLVSLQFMSPEE